MIYSKEYKDAYKLENYLHIYFNKKKRMYEWFNLDENDIIEAIKIIDNRSDIKPINYKTIENMNFVFTKLVKQNPEDGFLFASDIFKLGNRYRIGKMFKAIQKY